jgi:hypothetical protein
VLIYLLYPTIRTLRKLHMTVYLPPQTNPILIDILPRLKTYPLPTDLAIISDRLRQRQI